MPIVLLALLAVTAPDPRKGEPLDGRPPAEDPSRKTLAVPRLVLAGPRLAVRAALSPVVKATAWVEENDVVQRVTAVVTSDDGKVGARPELRYESAFGFAAGARYFDRRTLGEDSLLQVRFRTGGADWITSELRVRALRGLAGAAFRYQRNARAVFGPARYGVDRGGVGLSSERAFGPLTLRALGDLRVAVFEPGAMPIPDFVDETRLVSGGGQVELDTRGGRMYATGLALRGGAIGTRGFDGDGSRFGTFELEGLGALGLEERGVSLRVRGALIEGDAVPFDELLSPPVRGFAPGALRGRSEVVGSVEYQWHLIRNRHALLFVDYGAAFGERFEGLAWSRLESSVGAALRQDDAILRLAWAPGDGLQFLFAWGL